MIFSKQTNKPAGDYRENETSVCIFSKYKRLATLETYDPSVSICVVLDTPAGDLAVYGTITGIFGNRHEEFKSAVQAQTSDFARIGKDYPLCVAGDLNTSFCDNYYFTNYGRDLLRRQFQELNMINLTEGVEKNIDHIVISREVLHSAREPLIWNRDYKLSDHIGIAIELSLNGK